MNTKTEEKVKNIYFVEKNGVRKMPYHATCYTVTLLPTTPREDTWEENHQCNSSLEAKKLMKIENTGENLKS